MNVTGKSSPIISQSDIDSNKQSPNDLPDKPVIVIESSRSSLAINLYDLWQYRDLLYILTLRDIKVRYKQTVLGILWAVIQPLFMMIIFTLFFRQISRNPVRRNSISAFCLRGIAALDFLL